MRSETAMSAAMKSAGIDANEATLRVDLARYLNNGGTKQRLLDIVNELPGEGHGTSADEAGLRMLSARQQNGEGKGQRARADEATHRVPNPSPTQVTTAARILRAVPREPSRTDIAAMVTARKAAADIILKIDGDDIMDWTVGRALSIARIKGKENYVLSTLGGMYKHEAHTKTFRDVATPEIVKNIVRQAEAYGNAA